MRNGMACTTPIYAADARVKNVPTRGGGASSPRACVKPSSNRLGISRWMD
jgi:hypothetical protein